VGSYLYGAALSPDGKIVALADGRETIRLVDPATGKELRRFKVDDPTGAHFLLFSPDGRTLASTGHLGQISLREVSSGKKLVQFGTQRGGRSAAFVFSANSKVLVTGEADFRDNSSVTAWDATNGKQLGKFAVVHNIQLSVAVSPDGKTVATCGQSHRIRRGKGGEENLSGIIQLWDVAAGKELRRINSNGYYVSHTVFSPD